MSKNIIFIFLIIATVTYHEVDSQLITVAKAIGTGVSHIYESLSKGVDIYDKIIDDPEKNVTFVYISLKDSLKEIKEKLSKLTLEIQKAKTEERLLEMQTFIEDVDFYYEDFVAYSNSLANFSDYTKKTFAKNILNRNNGLFKRIRNFQSLLVLRGKDSLVKMLERNMDKLYPYCDSTQSRQQYFYKFFLSIISAHFKAYLVMNFALEITSQFENTTLYSEKNRLLSQTTDRIYLVATVAKEILERSSQEIWKCDPPKYEKNIHYFKLKNVFRVIFYDDKNFKDKRFFECSNECPVIEGNHDFVAKCHEKNRCSRQQRMCNNIVECTGIAFNGNYGVCVKNTTRGPRYTSIIDRNTQSMWEKIKIMFKEIFGAAPCNDGEFSLVETYVKASTIRREGYEDCMSCKCICDEKGPSRRYFSLTPVTSNIHSNKVVTGVRFVKSNNTVFLEIQQGKLVADGFINDASTKWKSVVDEVYDDDDQNNDDESVSNQRDKRFKLEWFGKRGLYLDDIELPKGEVVTGVKFSVDKQENEHFIKLDIRSTKFDLESGQLFPEQTYWYYSKAPEPKRTKLDLGNYDTPVCVPVMNKPDNETHQYTFVTPSRMLSKDIGQNVLPFIDNQPVTSYPAAPLSGVSLDIKRGGDSGGYLILKIQTYSVIWLLNY